MSTESENYSKGRSGIGAPDYTSPAWRAGDLERERSANINTKKYISDKKAHPHAYNIGYDFGNLIFSITPYLIVLYVLFNVITNAIDMFSSSFSYDFPEWLSGFVTLIAFSVVLFYKRYIGRIAIFSVAIIVAGMLISEYGKNFKFDIEKITTTKQVPKGCAICLDVMKNGAKLTPEYKSYFGITPKTDKNWYAVRCGGLKDYCSNNHSIKW